ncbi:hypothetical protein [Trichloromonas sp.]|uniref:hypothetical protein n=1 Tax=Trichloromonas sp. TaxID=3069249 RepID=UPI002A3A7B5F|nr:hypothetical protein [Trichloromonas sp.]
MLSFIQSMFNGHSDPEKEQIAAAIEQAVENTDPWIRAVSGYKKKLWPAVERAIAYLDEQVEGMAPPLSLDPSRYGDDPRLRAFFISSNALRKVLNSDPCLSEYRQKQGKPPAYALLSMIKQEKTVFGAEISGSVILHDVAQITVSFENHHLFAPFDSDKATRDKIKELAFARLLHLALMRITLLKAECAGKERRNALLQAQSGLQQHLRRGIDDPPHIAVPVPEMARAQVCRSLPKNAREDRLLDAYLEILREVLSQPEKHLWIQREALIVDRMGIKRREVRGDALEIYLDLLCNSEGHSHVISLVTLPR